MALARRLARALLADARARGDRPSASASASAFEFPRRARSSASASSSSTPKSDDSSSRASVALLAPAALTGALGAWQLARREEKIEAIDARARALETTVSASLARVGGGTPEYARASVAGELDLERTARVGPRARSVCGVTLVNLHWHPRLFFLLSLQVCVRTLPPLYRPLCLRPFNRDLI